MKNPKMNPVSNSPESWIETIWAALEQLDLSDEDSDEVNTAMAWITEELNLEIELDGNDMTEYHRNVFADIYKDLPDIPADWESVTYHNDTGPSWNIYDLNIMVFEKDRDEREYPELPRFMIFNAEENEMVYLETESWEAVLKFVAGYPEFCNIARAFSDLLKEEIGIHKTMQAALINHKAGYSLTCASHDYCDANMVMAYAKEMVTGIATDLDSDENLYLWGMAWTVAKADLFYTDPWNKTS